MDQDHVRDGESCRPKACCVRYNACQDLVQSRFCCINYDQFDIIGIQVHRITRVINRSLRLRFDDALRSYLDDDETYLPSTKLVCL